MLAVRMLKVSGKRIKGLSMQSTPLLKIPQHSGENWSRNEALTDTYRRPIINQRSPLNTVANSMIQVHSGAWYDIGRAG